ncbi:response regulator transcription factor [Variovorax sp. GT1P44]|uniref:helix-turn-helix transcriptional regulator n=1 Tax=Variovorax sp. GT1P44 TaxID=3443742 RepID=UPI003F480E8A
MNHLTRNDYAGALRLLARLEAESGDLECFARASVAALNEFVASELATLSVCDLVTGHRQVVGLPNLRLGAEDIACFDRHFFEHPLVRHHGIEGGRETHRISDALSARDFHRTPLYAEYYLRVGLEHAVAVPLFVDGRTLVSIVLNRRGLDFSERDRERLELLRPHLAYLYRQACASAVSSALPGTVSLKPAEPEALPAGLTLREGEVMHWLSRGKTDAEIAALLAISPRTVHKHLEHIYVKLGVETRTAAVMRSLAMRSPDGRAGPGGISYVSDAERASAAHTP